jgi:aspartate carbamoyltransferase catalytic subunit
MLGIEPLSAEEIVFLLDQAKPFQEIQRHPLKKLATLRGKTVALAFFEPSTRTRISFATAAARLGADTMNLQADSSSLKKGESLLDTVRTLEAMKPDCIVIRHGASGAPDFVARHLPLPVINAGDGTHEHPTQALLDALTIRDRLGRLEGLNVTILGDILHSRVARSNIHLLAKFGCRFALCGPAMWLPRELECLGPPGTSIRRVVRMEEALEGADVVMTLRVQQERLNEPALPQDEYVLQYQLTPERLRGARTDALVLHPGPMIRGVEIDPAVADGPQSCVLEQVTNGLAVRMALLFLLIGTDGSQAKETIHAAD